MTTINGLIQFLDESPSPWHVAASASQRLASAGFVRCDWTTQWNDVPVKGFVVRGAAVVAWNRGSTPVDAPIRLVGAHTDSPCLKIKPQPDIHMLGWRQLGVEIYGGALLNSWLDRDLGVAGRIELDDATCVDVVVNDSICRVPQLAIHLDRDVNDRGLVLDKQVHMTPVWGSGIGHANQFRDWLADQAAISPTTISSWDLCLFDRTPAALMGADQSLLASGRLDNQVSCWAAVEAITSSSDSSTGLCVIALFDHEEVGSESTTGASGPLLEQTLERLSLAGLATRQQFLSQLASSMCISADNAHAVHPNYVERHEPNHRPMVNHGPVLKINANQRYASSARSAAFLTQLFADAEIPSQTFVSRNNMPCGTTIGPLTATRLGIETVDVGVPQLSMHSARELCGVADPLYLMQALRHWFSI